MYKFKGTTGNWVFNNDCVITTEQVIGNIICDNPTHSHRSSKNWEANAKLIAAAPEMFELLKEILIDIDDVPIPTSMNDTLFRAKQLLTKITTP